MSHLESDSDPNSIRTDYELSTIEQLAPPSSFTIRCQFVSDELSPFERRTAATLTG